MKTKQAHADQRGMKISPAQRKLNRQTFGLIANICERAEKEITGWKENVERSSFVMDMDSIPELDLEKLLNAPKFDFAHDCCGIRRHMDRTNWPGKLMNCFTPRCCRSESVAA